MFFSTADIFYFSVFYFFLYVCVKELADIVASSFCYS